VSKQTTKVHRPSPHKGQRNLSICGLDGVRLADKSQRVTCKLCKRFNKQGKFSKDLAKAKTPGEVLRTFTPKEIAFAQHPLIMVDPRRAAVEAGYKASNDNVYAMRKKLAPLIRQIQLTRASEYLNPQPAAVISEMAKMAMMNQQDYFEIDESGARIPKQISHLTRDQLAAVSDIEMDWITIEDKDGNKTLKAVVTSIRLHNKLNALRSLAAVIGMNDPEFRRRWSEGEPGETADLKSVSTTDLKKIEKILSMAQREVRRQSDETDIVDGEFSEITSPKKR